MYIFLKKYFPLKHFELHLVFLNQFLKKDDYTHSFTKSQKYIKRTFKLSWK